jgi:hypothetical protein
MTCKQVLALCSLDYDLRLVVATERRTRCSATRTISVRQTVTYAQSRVASKVAGAGGWC